MQNNLHEMHDGYSYMETFKISSNTDSDDNLRPRILPKSRTLIMFCVANPLVYIFLALRNND